MFSLQVREIDGEDINVSYVKHVRSNNYTWPEKEDVSWILRSDIISILPEPHLERNMSITFLNVDMD